MATSPGAQGTSAGCATPSLTSGFSLSISFSSDEQDMPSSYLNAHSIDYLEAGHVKYIFIGLSPPVNRL